MKKQVKHIIWDWNGTLLDDLDQSIATMNELLAIRKFPLLSTQRYKEIFDFPVYDYYQSLGFNFSKEDWVDVASEYMKSYHSKAESFRLHTDTETILSHLKQSGIKHYILSAMKQESILEMLKHFDIASHFEGIYGLQNHYANSKITRAEELMHDKGLKPQECLLIGDTTHDAQVAKHIKVQCHLISNGHHSHRRLSATHKPTFTSISEWLNKF